LYEYHRIFIYIADVNELMHDTGNISPTK